MGERDSRNLIGDLLDLTGSFDRVYLSGLLEDRGESWEGTQAVTIEPWETRQSEPWIDSDGDPLLTYRLNLISLARQ